jgi:WD40 repeat protein
VSRPLAVAATLVLATYLTALAHASPPGKDLTIETGGNAKESLAFSPDGETLASCEGGDPPTVELWSTSDGSRRKALAGHEGRASSLSFSPRGDRLAAGGENLSVWRLPSGVREGGLPAVSSATLAALADGVLLLGDGETGEVRAWSFEKRAILWSVATTTSLSALLASPRGDCLALVPLSAEGIELRSIRDGKAVRTLEGPDSRPKGMGSAMMLMDRHVVFSPGGDLIASATLYSADVRVWSTNRETPFATLKHPGSGVTGLALGPDHRLVVARDREVRIVSLPEGHVVRALAPMRAKPSPGEKPDPAPLPASSVAFSGRGDCVAVGAADGTIRLSWLPTPEGR